jgi:integrase
VASVFKAKPSDDRYTIMYYDENGKRRKKMGYTDKRESQKLAVRLEDECRKVKNGDINPKDRAYRDHETKPLAGHLEDFSQYLLAKGCTDKHAQQTTQQVGRMIELAKAVRISGLSLSRFVSAAKALREEGWGIETVNHYIRSVKSFSAWLWRDGRSREHHLVHLATSNPDGDRRHVRRALTPDEAARVVQTAEFGPEVGNLSGPDRAMLYALALGTGLRAEELRSLTPERFNLDANPPTVTALAAYTKNGKEAVQPLALNLADRLRPWLALKVPGKSVFEGMTAHTAQMLRTDLEAAGIPYEVDSRVADFHSLRGCYISYLVSSGASVKTCQTLARHSTPSLTIGIYAKASLHDITGAVQALPDLTPNFSHSEAAVLKATGTDGATRTATDAHVFDTDESAQVQSSIGKSYGSLHLCSDDVQSSEHGSRH